MEETEAVNQIADELILGKDKNLGELKKILKRFFKAKTQNDFNVLNKQELSKLVFIHGLVINKSKFSELDRALVDKEFHPEKLLKYSWSEAYETYDENRLKRLIVKITNKKEFSSETKKEFSKWADWIINEKVAELGADDIEFENENKSLKVDIQILSGKISLSLIGKREYKYFMQECADILKEEKEKLDE